MQHLQPMTIIMIIKVSVWWGFHWQAAGIRGLFLSPVFGHLSIVLAPWIRFYLQSNRGFSLVWQDYNSHTFTHTDTHRDYIDTAQSTAILTQRLKPGRKGCDKAEKSGFPQELFCMKSLLISAQTIWNHLNEISFSDVLCIWYKQTLWAVRFHSRSGERYQNPKVNIVYIQHLL